MKRFAIISIGLLVAAGTVNACSSVPEDALYPCDPKAIIPDPLCLEQTSITEDAGSDAAPDVPSAIDDPGFPSSLFPPEGSCKTECVPEAAGPVAIDWPYEPLVVWFGSKAELETKTCPANTLYEKVRGFSNLVASPAKCDACECSADGLCTGLPENIEIRSGTCNMSNVQTTPFDGPPNWDGSCTSVNAMAAGQLCNGVPCAQSVSTLALPGPTDESCAPTVEKPNATLDKHEWLEGALACHAKDLVGTCKTTPEHCVDALPEGWLHCLTRPGKHSACPDNYNDSGPYWVYQDNPIDDRGCSACTCGAQKDGICTGSLSVYADSSCTSEFIKLPLSSADPSCGTITPAGRGVGSKTIDNLAYIPGTCAVSGGEPIGAVMPNDDEKSGVVTFCCRAPGPPPPPPPR